MHLTVEEALAIYPLSEARLIAGGKGKHRIVKSINVMDAPDISDWIKEGEMLLTTAYLIKDNLEEASVLLHKLHRRGAAGLGIKPGRFWAAVPEALIADAEALDFPLIELPFQFTFSDQMNGLFRAELARSTSVLQTVLEKQKTLMRYALRPDADRPLFDSVSAVIGHPLAVVNARGGIVYNNTPYTDSQLLAGGPWPSRNQRFRIGEEAGLRLPLRQNDKSFGHLLFCPIDPLLLHVEESLFVQGAELIAFQLHSGYGDYFEHDSHREFSRLLRQCLNGSLTCGELAQAAAELGIGILHSSYQLLLTNTGADGDHRQAELLRIKEEYLEYPALRELNGIHVLVEEGLVSLFPWQPCNPERLQNIILECFHAIRTGARCYPRGAISNGKVKAEGIREAYAEVRECMVMARQWNGRSQVVHYRQMELSLLLGHIPEAAMRKYCSDSLRELLNREPDYVKEMLHTLEMYLENDGHVNETAKKLFIHRNTATYRMEKLSELLNVDFKNMNDILRLKLVFMFRSMLEEG